MTATTKRAAMLERIRLHGERLLAIFPDATTRSPIDLCKRLRKLELQGAAISLQQCNGPAISEADLDRKKWVILTNANAILQPVKQRIPILFNDEPRGNCLKIDAENMRNIDLYRDMGGDGIIAPDLSEDS